MIRLLIVGLACLWLSAPVALGLTLNRGNGAEPDTLDPQKYNLTVELNIIADLFEGLVTADEKGNPIPGIAERWDVSADGTVYTFHLRPDLKWSDGVALTADDVVAGFRRGVDPKTGAQLVDLAYVVKNARAIAHGEMPPDQLGVRAVDARTVEVTLEGPSATFIRLAGNFALFFPVPRHVLAAAGDQWVRPGVMVSNGPYKLAEWTPQARVRLVRNPAYWNAASVKVDEVDFYPAADENAALKQFRNNELDFHLGFPVAQIEWLRRNMPNEMHLDPASTVTFLAVNQAKAPFNDVRVRRALSLAIDRDTLTARVLNAGQVPAYHFAPLIIEGWKPSPDVEFGTIPLAQRQAEARKLLAEAGYGPDHPLTFRFDYRAGDANRKAVVAIAGMWAQIGVQADLQANEVKVHYAKIRQKDFEVADAGWQGTPDPEFFVLLLRSTSESNYGSWSNAEFDRLTDEASITLDPAKRMTLYVEADRIAMQDVAFIPVMYGAHRALVHTWVTGFAGNALNAHLSRFIGLER
ncbi:MAG: peptide ABC transporter substrate-binding protein [Alphaproteobacteria bacterium]|nr:peptide ABC transporter substrate-binding protein [Alphaproteobacteria bacterium]